MKGSNVNPNTAKLFFEDVVLSLIQGTKHFQK